MILGRQLCSPPETRCCRGTNREAVLQLRDRNGIEGDRLARHPIGLSRWPRVRHSYEARRAAAFRGSVKVTRFLRVIAKADVRASATPRPPYGSATNQARDTQGVGRHSGRHDPLPGLLLEPTFSPNIPPLGSALPASFLAPSSRTPDLPSKPVRALERRPERRPGPPPLRFVVAHRCLKRGQRRRPWHLGQRTHRVAA